jgi:hypothetical protein
MADIRKIISEHPAGATARFAECERRVLSDIAASAERPVANILCRTGEHRDNSGQVQP